MAGGYTAALSPMSSGAPASTGGNITTDKSDVVARGARADRSTLHIAIGVVVLAVVVLSVGRGYLRNARIA